MKDVDALSLDKVRTIHDLPKMFDKHCGTMKYVCAKVVVCVHDQIDRRGVLNLAFGNGKYHGMFGWSYDFSRKYKQIVACEKCHQSMLSEYEYYECGSDQAPYHWRTGECKDCSACGFATQAMIRSNTRSHKN